MTNPDGKYGRENVQIHQIESFKDCIMMKLKYSGTLDFRRAVRSCIPFAKENGFDIDKNPQRFYAKLFDELSSLEHIGHVKIDKVEQDGRDRIERISLTDKGKEWFNENDFDIR